MSNWSDFEIDCKNYLNNNFNKYARFELGGGSDSTSPDIKVTTLSGNVFYIEAKLCPAQCGQFVLLPDIESREFVYSKGNTSQINIFSRKIIEHMNKYFDQYKKAGTAGENIEFINSSETFYSWIIDNYKNNGVKFFITNNYTLIPIERFSEFFYVFAVYRVKRSGSSAVGKTNMNNIINHVKTHDQNYVINNPRANNTKLFVESTKPIHNKRFHLLGFEYMFSHRKNEYEIRKLSNTFNANVIFSIDLKPYKNGITHDDFIDALN